MAIHQIERAAARVAVQFGRQPAAQALSTDEIAGDAIRLAKLGAKIRVRVERQQEPNGELTEFRSIAERYGAKTVENFDLDGCVVGLTFRSGLYSSGFRNVFFVA